MKLGRFGGRKREEGEGNREEGEEEEELKERPGLGGKWIAHILDFPPFLEELVLDGWPNSARLLLRPGEHWGCLGTHSPGQEREG